MESKTKRKIQIAIVYCDQSKQKKLLLLKLIPERGGHWQNVTGHVEAGETLKEAARRELSEETSIPETNSQLVETNFQFNFTDRFHMPRVEYGFIAWVETEKVIIDPNEHTEFKWISLDEVTESDLGFSTHWEFVQLLKAKV